MGCCWQPVSNSNVQRLLRESSDNGIPWCYYPDSCQSLFFTAADPGFSQVWYTNMYNKFVQNLDIEQKGGVCASPNKYHPMGSADPLRDTYYYYHWTRDGGLSMKTFIELK